VTDYEVQAIRGVDDVPPAKPGQAIKFMVVDPATGNQSSTWRVFTGKRTDDVYLLEVVSGPTWKTSHHNDGEVWRVAMTSEAADQRHTARVVIDEWPRMPPQEGWSEGVTVLVPSAYLRSSEAQVDSSVVRIPTSPEHSAVAVRLLFAESGTESYIELSRALPVGVLSRPHGGAVYLVAEAVALNSKQHNSLAALCENARESVLAGDNPSGRFVGVLEAGEHRFLVDLTVKP
jgi:hypothetical protein